MGEFVKECFNKEGRWNRQKFIFYPIGFSFLIIIPILLINFLLLTLMGEDAISLVFIVYFLLYIPLVYVSILSYVKRLHDMDKNGWMTLLMFVPLANIYLAIICLFVKGTQGPNQYGADPLGGVAIPNVNKSETGSDEIL